MRNLYLKIFLWFWAAMAFISLSLLLVSALAFSQEKPEQRGDPFRVFAYEAVRIYERDGANALADYLKFLDDNLKRPSYLCDLQGRELASRALPAMLQRQIIASPEPMPGFPQGFRVEEALFVPVKLQGQMGGQYIFLSELPAAPLEISRYSPQRLTTIILVILTTAGVGCYFLARYLTAPIMKLRETTRLLAQGDLSARVGKSIGKRQDEVADLAKDFDRMAEKIQALVDGQNRLLGDISHELRSPLARLNLALGVARRHAGESAARAHDRIEREAERLNELIEQLLRLTELESGASLVQVETINLSELVAEIAADANFEAKSKNRTVQIVAIEAITITGDSRLLRSAIENVVRNAIRYTPECKSVDIALTLTSEQHLHPVQITVRDYGAGVPVEALSQLFLPFYRVDHSRDRHSGGVGLGLSITERAIRLHNGMVSAFNAPEGGLIITLALPLRKQL